MKAEKAKAAKRKAAKAPPPASLRELLRQVIDGEKLIADRLESVRRTLWRMDEVRKYENKSGAGKPDTGKPDAETKGGES